MTIFHTSRSHFVRKRLEEALEAADVVGFWNAPPGFLIYMAVNILSGKSYIGQTVNFIRRVRSHKGDAERGVVTPLYAAMRRDGVCNFTFVPIEYFSTKATLDAGERDAIATYHTRDPDIGYNIAEGGNGLGSEGAKAIHARPEFRERFLASYPGRSDKAARTRARRKLEGYYS